MNKGMLKRTIHWLLWWYPVITILFLVGIHLIFFFLLSTESFEKYIPFISQIIGFILIVISISHDFDGIEKKKLKERISDWWDDKPNKDYRIEASGGQYQLGQIKLGKPTAYCTPDSLESIRKDLMNHIKRFDEQYDEVEQRIKMMEKSNEQDHNQIHERIDTMDKEETRDVKYNVKLQFIGLIFAIYGTYIGTFGNVFLLDLFS